VERRSGAGVRHRRAAHPALGAVAGSEESAGGVPLRKPLPKASRRDLPRRGAARTKAFAGALLGLPHRARRARKAALDLDETGDHSVTDLNEQADRAAATVDDKKLVSLLQRMIQHRSYSAGGEEGEIARFMQAHCRGLGLDSVLQEVQPGRFNVISTLKGAG